MRWSNVLHTNVGGLIFADFFLYHLSTILLMPESQYRSMHISRQSIKLVLRYLLAHFQCFSLCFLLNGGCDLDPSYFASSPGDFAHFASADSRNGAVLKVMAHDTGGFLEVQCIMFCKSFAVDFWLFI